MKYFKLEIIVIICAASIIFLFAIMIIMDMQHIFQTDLKLIRTSNFLFGIPILFFGIAGTLYGIMANKRNELIHKVSKNSFYICCALPIFIILGIITSIL